MIADAAGRGVAGVEEVIVTRCTLTAETEEIGGTAVFRARSTDNVAG